MTERVYPLTTYILYHARRISPYIVAYKLKRNLSVITEFTTSFFIKTSHTNKDSLFILCPTKIKYIYLMTFSFEYNKKLAGTNFCICTKRVLFGFIVNQDKAVQLFIRIIFRCYRFVIRQIVNRRSCACGLFARLCNRFNRCTAFNIT